MYKYSENTLIHSPGVDFAAIDSIMKNGIMSLEYASKHGVDVNRNYYGSNLNDTISCIRYLYVNSDMKDSAYSKYVPNGVSFLIEDVPFIYDKNERIIHRSDEVLVEDFIPKEKITGILVPENLTNVGLEDMSYIMEDSSSYVLIKHKVDNIKSYILNLSGDVCNYDDFIQELYYLNEESNNDNSDLQRDEIISEFRDVISDLNYEIGLNFHTCFSKVLGKSDINILDIIKYMNSKTLNLPIYFIKDKPLTRKKN